MSVTHAPDSSLPVEGGAQPENLWRHRNFLYLWGGQTVSTLGSAVTFVALPLVGVLLLDLDAFEVGLLATVTTLSATIVGPFVGTIVDRLDRRRLMIATDIGRAVLLASLPAAALGGLLNFGHLLVVSGGLSVLTLLFNVAHQAYLPRVVKTASLADGNGKLEASQSAAEVAGPGMAGWLVVAAGPAVALVLDATSYVVSALCLHRLRLPRATPDTALAPDTPGIAPAVLASAPQPTEPMTVPKAGFWADTKTGFVLLWRDPVLRAVSISYSVLAFFSQVQMAVYMLFLVRWMEFSPLLIGVVFSLSSLAGLVSAVAGGKLAARLGIGRMVVIGQALTVAGAAFLAAIGGSTVQAAVMMLIAEAFFAAGMALYGVGSRTLVQERTTDEVRGRVIGASRAMTGATVVFSGLVAGGVGASYGLRAAMVVGAVGMTLALGLVLRPLVWTVNTPSLKEKS